VKDMLGHISLQHGHLFKISFYADLSSHILIACFDIERLCSEVVMPLSYLRV